MHPKPVKARSVLLFFIPGYIEDISNRNCLNSIVTKDGGTDSIVEGWENVWPSAGVGCGEAVLQMQGTLCGEGCVYSMCR